MPLLTSLKPCTNSKIYEADDSCLSYSTTHKTEHKIQQVHFLNDLSECLEKELALTDNERRESVGNNYIVKPEKLIEEKTFCACTSTGPNESRPEDFQANKFNTFFFVK